MIQMVNTVRVICERNGRERKGSVGEEASFIRSAQVGQCAGYLLPC